MYYIVKEYLKKRIKREYKYKNLLSAFIIQKIKVTLLNIKEILNIDYKPYISISNKYLKCVYFYILTKSGVSN